MLCVCERVYWIVADKRDGRLQQYYFNKIRSWWAGLQDLAEQPTRPKARSRRRPFVVSVYFQQTGKSSCVMKLVLKVETLPAAGV